MKILLRFLLPSLLLLTTSLTAQVPAAAPANADSAAAQTHAQASADTTQSDSLQQAVSKIDTVVFKIPATAHEAHSERVSEFLFQDLAQLFSNTLPAIPIVTGEVGQPRYIAAGELPARTIPILVDSLPWIPGVYGTVDLTSLPEAGADNTHFAGLNPPRLAVSAATVNLRVASNAIRYEEPLTRIGYAKGPYGADATRISFSRAFSRRLTGAVHAAFSNADGQFVDLPYEGHKARLRFDYRLFRDWRLAYLHFNTRNEAGVAVPFFPEEWPAVNGAFHKEERLYHAVELAPAREVLVRAFYWQVKEELNDPARQIRHRLRDAGAEAAWLRQRERYALALHLRGGNEQIHSDSIIPATRGYANAAAAFSWKPAARFWLQGEAQYQHKADWPAGHALAISGLWQFRPAAGMWLRARQQRVPPALSERENQLAYLSANPTLEAVRLSHFEGGFFWRQKNLALQAQLGGGHWQDGFIFTADSAAGPAYLRNDEHPEQSLCARLQLLWMPAEGVNVFLLGTQSWRELPPHYWFWHQPEGFARLHVETRRTFFNKNLEVLPRLCARYLGRRTSPVFTAASVLPQFKTLAAATTLDFHLRLRHGSGALLLSWENLLNDKYELREGVPDAGLVFRWGFQWVFRD